MTLTATPATGFAFQSWSGSVSGTSNVITFLMNTDTSVTANFTPLPVRWRVEATFGTQTNRYRHLTRNLTQSPTAAEDAVYLANFHRVLKAYHREESNTG